MTSAAVTQLSEMVPGISTGNNQVETQTGEFAGVFQSAADKSMDNTVGTTEEKEAVRKVKSVGGTKRAEELRERRTDNAKAEAKEIDTAKVALEETVDELKTEIAEKLDITVEELEEIMKTLGLTDASLFTQEGMTNFVMEVTQITNPIELLTNADAYQMLQELNTMAEQLLSEVQDKFQLSDAEVESMLKSMEQQATQTVEDGVSVIKNGVEDTDVVNEQSLEKNVSTETKNGVDAEEQSQTENVESAKTTIQESDSGERLEQHAANEQNANQNNAATMQSNQSLGNTQMVNQAVTEFAANLPEGNVSAQEIYDQIGEYVKTNVRPGVSEVEMQLNPESLGFVHVHVSAKQGNLTAQFIVQNEAVKAALEMQMLQLKADFEQQGIKVEAVEVAVESQAFNQNMEQNDGKAEAQQETKRQGIRSLNLNEELEEELTEEEQLVVEMMEANGNTINYQA